MYQVLADALVVVHLAYVGFVVIGELLVLVGALLGWQWIANPWFRWAHLLAIATVVVEAVAGIACPLTVWERQLREAAGKSQPDETFVGRIVHDVLFFDLPPWVFTSTYVAFGLLVLATFIWIPPRRAAKRGQSTQKPAGRGISPV